MLTLQDIIHASQQEGDIRLFYDVDTMQIVQPSNSNYPTGYGETSTSVPCRAVEFVFNHRNKGALEFLSSLFSVSKRTVFKSNKEDSDLTEKKDRTVTVSYEGWRNVIDNQVSEYGDEAKVPDLITPGKKEYTAFERFKFGINKCRSIKTLNVKLRQLEAFSSEEMLKLSETNELKSLIMKRLKDRSFSYYHKNKEFKTKFGFFADIITKSAREEEIKNVHVAIKRRHKEFTYGQYKALNNMIKFRLSKMKFENVIAMITDAYSQKRLLSIRKMIASDKEYFTGKQLLAFGKVMNAKDYKIRAKYGFRIGTYKQYVSK